MGDKDYFSGRLQTLGGVEVLRIIITTNRYIQFVDSSGNPRRYDRRLGIIDDPEDDPNKPVPAPLKYFREQQRKKGA